MPLKINLRAGELIYISGAVIQNASASTVSLRVLNNVPLLRSNSIMTEERANSPARRIYFAAQSIYLGNKSAANFRVLAGLMSDYVSAAPSATPLISNIGIAIQSENPYTALKIAQDLMAHEEKLLNSLTSDSADQDAGGKT